MSLRHAEALSGSSVHLAVGRLRRQSQADLHLGSELKEEISFIISVAPIPLAGTCSYDSLLACREQTAADHLPLTTADALQCWPACHTPCMRLRHNQDFSRTASKFRISPHGPSPVTCSRKSLSVTTRAVSVPWALMGTLARRTRATALAFGDGAAQETSVHKRRAAR